ncbi:MAG TPA: metallophosphoesterase [Gaiellaceae bacterium]
MSAAGLAWGWFEAGWLRRRVLELPLPELPPELDGLRIVHLSDFHLGLPSRGAHAVAEAVTWADARRPDLVVVTGDLLSRPAGEPALRRHARRLAPCFAILGNHDLAISRDPFSKRVELGELEPTTLLHDEGRMLELRGRSVWLAGVHPVADLMLGARRTDPNSLAREADFRILLCHFPRVLDRLEPDRFDLVLAGHMHDGQICLPYPGGKVRLAHPHAAYSAGVYRHRAAVMHVSPGLGTTFVPFRFAARPEVTELVLRAQSPALQST